jgi:hypothetical protein
MNIEMYKDWLKEFRLSEYNGEINILLGNNPKLREIYAKIVPSKVDNHAFWNRYFFKVYVAEMEKEIRQTKVFEQLTLDTGAIPKLRVDDKKGGKSIFHLNFMKSSFSDSEVSPANTENESWSVCSSGADDLQELPDEIDSVSGDKTTGPLTPKASDESPPAEGWEQWDQKPGDLS